MKVNFIRRQPVNLAFGVGDALKDGDGFLLHPRRKLAARNQLFDFGKTALTFVRVSVFMVRVMVVVRMVVNVQAAGGFVRVTGMRFVAVMVVVFVREVHIQLHAGDGGFFAATDVEMIAVKLELFQLALQLFGVHT